MISAISSHWPNYQKPKRIWWGDCYKMTDKYVFQETLVNFTFLWCWDSQIIWWGKYNSDYFCVLKIIFKKFNFLNFFLF
jgi:hypothetical protein